MPKRLGIIAFSFIVPLLAACGGGSGNSGETSNSVGGTVIGLTGQVVLQDNGGDNVTVAANGIFVFPTPVPGGHGYKATILTQPTGQTCAITAAAGTISGGNVSNISVICTTSAYAVGGTITGLAGTVVLQDSGADNITIANNGIFSFPAAVTNGGAYSVTILSQPTDQTCTVSSGAGIVSAGRVSNVTVICDVNAYTVGGAVTGLNGSVALQDNNNDTLVINSNGAFKFVTPVANGSPYGVSVLTEPANQSCSIGNGIGTVERSDVNSVNVVCAANMYPVGGTVTGLHGSLVLQDNGADNITITTDGAFKFPTTVAGGDSYSVTVYASPTSPHQICTVASGSGTVSAAVSNVSVACGTQSGIAYVGESDNQIYAYGIDADTGLLAPMGAVATGSYAIVDPTNKFAYVGSNTSHSSGNNISAYAINASGGLDLINQIAAVAHPQNIAVDPGGKFIYSGAQVVEFGGSSILAYSTNLPNGSLTSAASIALDNAPLFVAIPPAGHFSYVATLGDSSISAFSIDATTGTFTSIGEQATGSTFGNGTQQSSAAFSPGGKFFYVTNYGSNSVFEFSMNGTTGALTEIGTFATGAGPAAIAIAPSGNFAYITNYGDSSIWAYSIDAGSGVLSKIGVYTLSPGSEVGVIAIDSVGKYAYVSFDSGINIYSIDATNGALTNIGSVSAQSPASIALVPLE